MHALACLVAIATAAPNADKPSKETDVELVVGRFLYAAVTGDYSEAVVLTRPAFRKRLEMRAGEGAKDRAAAGLRKLISDSMRQQPLVVEEELKLPGDVIFGSDGDEATWCGEVRTDGRKACEVIVALEKTRKGKWRVASLIMGFKKRSSR